MLLPPVLAASTTSSVSSLPMDDVGEFVINIKNVDGNPGDLSKPGYCEKTKGSGLPHLAVGMEQLFTVHGPIFSPSGASFGLPTKL